MRRIQNCRPVTRRPIGGLGGSFLMAVTGYRLCSFVPADMVLPIAGSMLHTTCQ